jgi:hypothetical protein
MFEEDGFTFDENTGEIFSEDNFIGPKGLYTPLGIPAYNVLWRAKEHAANNMLACLLSHRHKGSNEVWPSLNTIVQKTGHGKKTILKAKEVLVEFGFIKIKKKWNGKTWENHYFIQDACFHTAKLNEKARSFLTPVGSCLVCTKALRPGDFKIEDSRMAHWGCSGNIQKIRAKRYRANGKKMGKEEQSASA